MKRALAERAKQHADQQQKQQQQCNVPSSPARKAPRTGRASTSLQPTPTRPSTSSKKRQRPPSPSDDNDSDDDSENLNTDAFYLKHQNKQLGSELMSYKREISLLERERTIRRTECRRIGEVLGQMESIFRTGECFILGKGTNIPTSSLEKLQQDCCSNIISHFITPSSIPSTGKESDVETIQQITDALSRMIQSPVFSQSMKQELDDSKVSIKQNDDQNSSIKTNFKNDAIKQEHHDLTLVVPKSKQDLQLGKQNLQNEEYFLSSMLSSSNNGKDQIQMINPALRSFAQRWFYYHKYILDILQSILQHNNMNNALSQNNFNKHSKNLQQTDLFDAATLHKQISNLQKQSDGLKSQVDELSKARDEASESERRVRRALYRLASGRWKISDVLKSVDNDKSSLIDIADVQDTFVAVSDTSASAAVGSINAGGSMLTDNKNGKNEEVISSAEEAQLKKQLQDLKEIADTREKKISELLSEQEKLNQKINAVLLSHVKKSSEIEIDEDDIKKSDIFTATSSKLVSAQREVKILKSELLSVNKRWAQTKGDIILANKTIANVEEKHARRWKELTCTDENTSIKTGSNQNETNSLLNNSSRQNEAHNGHSNEKKFLYDAKKIVELEHKLKHALENVRQSENIRASLAEANKINETLQSKLDELKVKNSALVANKATARASSLETASSSHSSSHKSSRESSGGHLSLEKLQRDYRKSRKELSAALQSKEGAKSKQERAEKERDAFMKTNTRLVKQSSEKDDMNAKSLSTILHLKHLSEELEKEKIILEKRLKAAEQMALASRLAVNAKIRVEEEALREKEAAYEELKQVGDQIKVQLTEKEYIQSQLEQSKAQIASTEKDVKEIWERCDELVLESSSREEETRSLLESLAVARKEAAEAKKKAIVVAANAESCKGGGSTQFTAEQLTIQVNNLKSRLACPVCNHRDKQVILGRCRHMFCRQCVDKNIKNRSRKCPACAQRFDMKDVGDVWL